MTNQIAEFVTEVHNIMRDQCNETSIEGKYYWRHWSSAITRDTEAEIDGFYDSLYSINELAGEFKHGDAIQGYNKIIAKIASGKKFNSRTGRLLASDRRDYFMWLIAAAISYCEIHIYL